MADKLINELPESSTFDGFFPFERTGSNFANKGSIGKLAAYLKNLIASAGVANFQGIAYPDSASTPTVPQTSTVPQIWIGSPGTYSAFNGVQITGQAGFITGNPGAWVVENINIDLSAIMQDIPGAIINPGGTINIDTAAKTITVTGESGNIFVTQGSNYYPVNPGTTSFVTDAQGTSGGLIFVVYLKSAQTINLYFFSQLASIASDMIVLGATLSFQTDPSKMIGPNDILVNGLSKFVNNSNLLTQLGNYTLNNDFLPVKSVADNLSKVLDRLLVSGLFLTDDVGNIALQLLQDGTLDGIKAFFNLLGTQTLNVDKSNVSGIFGQSLVLTDDFGNIVFDAGNRSYLPAPVINSSYDIVVNNGQSNSLGIDAARVSYPEQLKDGLKLKGYGYWEDPQNQSLTELQILDEGGTFESPAFGMAKMEITSLINENNFVPSDNDFKIVMVEPGVGGTSINGLAQGTAPYTKMLQQIQAIVTIANAAGKTSKVSREFWTQGEADIGMATADYKTKLNTRWVNINADIKSITGQTEDIKIIFYQLSGYNDVNISTAFFQLFQEYPERFHLALPTYQFSFNTTNKVHFFSGIESRNYGAFMGYVGKKITRDLQDWKPLYPVEFVKQAKIIDVKFFVPKGKLTFDTSVVTDPGNYGFTVLDDSGNPVAIYSVQIIRPDTVRIVCASNIYANYKLNYAYKNGTNGENGRTIGSRGCLRDQMGDSVVFMPHTVNFKLHNYCTIFTHTFE
jgi:hypothetical protein